MSLKYEPYSEPLHISASKDWRSGNSEPLARTGGGCNLKDWRWVQSEPLANWERVQSNWRRTGGGCNMNPSLLEGRTGGGCNMNPSLLEG